MSSENVLNAKLYLTKKLFAIDSWWGKKQSFFLKSLALDIATTTKGRPNAKD